MEALLGCLVIALFYGLVRFNTTPYVRPTQPYSNSPWQHSDAGDPTFNVNAISGTAITVNVVFYKNRLEPVGVFPGNPVTTSVSILWYLSTDSAGQDILASGSGASGGVAVGTNGTLQQFVTGCSGFCIPNLANGEIDIVITDASARTLYLNVVNPSGGVHTSPALVF